MNNDLISREALKRKLQYVYSCEYIGSKSKEGIVSDIIDEIDNAPTVEIPENSVNCVLTMFGNCSYNETGCSDCEIKNKILKALKERPKGKWVLVKTNYDDGGNNLYECTHCHHSDMHSGSTEVPYCWYCGADMQEEVEE